MVKASSKTDLFYLIGVPGPGDFVKNFWGDVARTVFGDLDCNLVELIGSLKLFGVYAAFLSFKVLIGIVISRNLFVLSGFSMFAGCFILSSSNLILLALF